MKRWVTLGILVMMTGCAALFSPHPDLAGEPWAVVYPQNTDCYDRQPDLDPADIDNPDPPAHTPAQWARRVMCGGASAGHVAMRDVVFAAGDVMRCTERWGCKRKNEDAQDWPAVAFLWDVAERTDPGDVAAELAKSGLPAYFQADFVARYRAAQQHLRDIVAQQGVHWRDVMLAPALDARAARKTAEETLAPWNDKVGAIVHTADQAVVDGRSPGAALVRVLVARREYVSACRKAGVDLLACVGDRRGRKLSAAIVRVADASGDPVLAAVESGVANAIGPPDEAAEYLAEQRAFDAERARWDSYRKLRDSGIAKDVLAAKWPEPPLDLGEERPWFGRDAVENVAIGNMPHGSGGGTYVDDQVRAVQRHGADATVLFQKRVFHGVQGTNCHEGNRVDHIDADGNVVYREVCTGPDIPSTADETKPPVQVPASEVTQLRPGEIAHVLVDPKTRRGHVVSIGEPRPADDQITNTTPTVQLGEWRLR
jgi:hypothetical protein